MGFHVGGAPDKVIMNMAAADMGCHDQSVLPAQDFIGELLSYFMRCFGGYLTGREWFCCEYTSERCYCDNCDIAFMLGDGAQRVSVEHLPRVVD